MVVLALLLELAHQQQVQGLIPFLAQSLQTVVVVVATIQLMAQMEDQEEGLLIAKQGVLEIPRQLPLLKEIMAVTALHLLALQIIVEAVAAERVL
ncbi:MAG: hypothetical protein EBR82_73900 [Caulobacteraceae bacterium]|nr:hypothetical protein [Caulobacteraceae bacterium]